MSHAVGCLANSEVRSWTLTDGRKLSAELVSYNEQADVVTLRINERDPVVFLFNMLSPSDQAWVVEWIDLGERLDAVLARVGGEFLHFVSQGAYPTGYHVYLPPGVKEGPSPPMLLFFDPAGNGERYVKRYIEAAAEAKFVVVGLDEFRNTPPPDGDELDARFRERFLELLPQIKATVRHDPARVFLGGTSGGAMRAFGYAATIEGPWAGVFSNVGWLGPKEEAYALRFPAGMRVAFVDGNNDRGGNYKKRDSEILLSYGNTVGFFSFEGGHQLPPPASQLKAMRWLLSREP